MENRGKTKNSRKAAPGFKLGPTGPGGGVRRNLAQKKKKHESEQKTSGSDSKPEKRSKGGPWGGGKGERGRALEGPSLVKTTPRGQRGDGISKPTEAGVGRVPAAGPQKGGGGSCSGLRRTANRTRDGKKSDQGKNEAKRGDPEPWEPKKKRGGPRAVVKQTSIKRTASGATLGSKTSGWSWPQGGEQVQNNEACLGWFVFVFGVFVSGNQGKHPRKGHSKDVQISEERIESGLRCGNQIQTRKESWGQCQTRNAANGKEWSLETRSAILCTKLGKDTWERRTDRWVTVTWGKR